MKALLYVAIFFLSIFVGTQIALAFEPWNQRLYPGGSYNTPMIAKVTATSTMTYEAIDQFGWNGWADVVARSIETSSSDPDSLGSVYNGFLASENRGQITIRKAQGSEQPDMSDYAVSTAFLEAKCGTWATACVYLFNALPRLPAYYKAAAMITWSYQSNAPVVRHETNHALARACDEYKGGCPRASDGGYDSQVVCTGNPDTLMDCGGAARTATRFDYETFKLAYPPTAPFLQFQAPPPGSCDGFYGPFDPSTNGCWHNDIERWYFPDSWSWHPDTGCGQWFNPSGVFAFGACDASWNGRFVPILGPTVWLIRSTPFVVNGTWYQVP